MNLKQNSWWKITINKVTYQVLKDKILNEGDLSSAMLRRSVWYKLNDVSKVLTPSSGSRKQFWNVGHFLPDYKVQHPEDK
jgi:hypothetical protein